MSNVETRHMVFKQKGILVERKYIFQIYLKFKNSYAETQISTK